MLLYLPVFQITVQVEKEIYVPSQTREKPVDAKPLIKFSGLPNPLFTTFFLKRKPKASFYANLTQKICVILLPVFT